LFDRFELDLMSAIQMAILAIVAIVLGLFVVRPLLSRNPQNEAPPAALLPATTEPEPNDALTGEVSGELDDFPDLQLDDSFSDMPALNFANVSGDGSASDDPVDRLRAMIGERQEETVEILRSWLEESEERA